MTELDFNAVEEIISKFTERWKKDPSHVVMGIKGEHRDDVTKSNSIISDPKR